VAVFRLATRLSDGSRTRGRARSLNRRHRPRVCRKIRISAAPAAAARPGTPRASVRTGPQVR